MTGQGYLAVNLPVDILKTRILSSHS